MTKQERITIQELMTTLGNELANNRGWRFNEKKVEYAGTQKRFDGELGLLVGLDDGTDIMLTVEVLNK